MALAIRSLGRGDGRASARPRRGAEDRRAGDARGRRPPAARPAPTSVPRTPARCCAPGWRRWTSASTSTSCSSCSRRASSAIPTCTAAPAASTNASWPTRSTRSSTMVDEQRARPRPRCQDASFDACIPAIPYAAAAAFLGREKLKLTRSDGDRPRVALVADGLGGMHGVTHTIQQIRDRGVPGYEVEVIGTDADVDRRLSAVAEIDIPFYRGPEDRRADACRRSSRRWPRAATTSSTSARPGPPASAPGCWPACSSCRWSAATTPSWPPTPACAPAWRSSRPWPALALGAFYGACDVVLSPSPASDERLARAGYRRAPDRPLGPRRRPRALRPGAAHRRAASRRDQRPLRRPADPGEGRRAARRRVPRRPRGRTRGCTWCSPAAAPRRTRCASGWASTPPSSAGSAAQDLARAYASADVFLFASRTDTFGQVILEAQASGLPVVAVDEGGPASLIDDGETGLLAAGRPRGAGRARCSTLVAHAAAARAPAQDRAGGGPRAHLGGVAGAPGGRLPLGSAARPVPGAARNVA